MSSAVRQFPNADPDTANLLANLADLLAEMAGDSTLAVAFSGGIDSTLVAEVATLAVGDRAAIITLEHPLAAPADIERATALAHERGYRHEVIPVDTLCEAEIAHNGPERCYHCKRLLMSAIRERVGGDIVIVDGTNADDARSPRPGIRALRELDVRSPLAELGITKAQVRAIAELLDLPNATAPSAPCVATRFPYGEDLRAGEFGSITWAERRLRDAAFQDVRVRMGESGVAELQVADRQVEEARDVQEDIEAVIADSGLELEEGFAVNPYHRNDPTA